MKKYFVGQLIEMLGEKHGGGFNEASTGWQSGVIQKVGKTTITIKCDGWQPCNMSIEAFEEVLERGTMRLVMQEYNVSGVVDVAMYQSLLQPEYIFEDNDRDCDSYCENNCNNFDAEAYKSLVLERAIIELKKLLDTLPDGWRCEYVEGSAEIYANYNHNILDRLYFKVRHSGVNADVSYITEEAMQKYLTDFFSPDWNAEFGAQYRIYKYIVQNYCECEFQTACKLNEEVLI